MKKFVATLILAIFLTGITSGPAKALILDPLQLATKVSGYLQDVKEGVDKVTQQINQIKMMSTQGFTLSELTSLAKKYILTEKFKKAIKKKMKKIVENRKKKKLKAQQDKMKWEKETKIQLYTDKLNVVNKDIEILENSLQEVETELNQKKQECEDKRIDMENETDSEKKVEKNDIYEQCKSEQEELENNKIEQTEMIKKYKKDAEEIKAKLEKVKSGDAEYKEQQAMINATEAAQDSEEIIEADNLGQNDEWDNEQSMSKFNLEEKDYQDFISRYFYDPSSIKGEGSTGMIDYQSKMDRVTRERRFLLVNTSVHLLQVVTSVRREIPVREHSLEAYSNQTAESKDELEAVSAYAATRIEAAKALLLYAKVMSAKLQYLAARDLLNESLSKELTDPVTGKVKEYKDFDLGKYILTPEFIKYQLKKSNPEKDLVDQVEVEEN